MKIHLQPDGSRTAAALFFVVIMLVMTSLMLMSYFRFTQNEYISVQRSGVWNAALVNAESGVEEALAMINTDRVGVYTVTNWPNLATVSGWDTNGAYVNVYSWVCTTGQIFHISRKNYNSGGAGGRGGYDVYVNSEPSGTNTGPQIYSVGYADWAGVGTTATNTCRRLYIQTTAVSELYGGIVAQQDIDFHGQNVTIDSWDSSTPLHSIWHTNFFFRGNCYTNGSNYGTWSNSLSFISNNIPSRTADTHVFTQVGAISAGSANIAGYIETGPGGTESIKSGGYVGDLAWVFNSVGNSPGNAYQSIQPGHYKTDANKNFYSKTLFINCLTPTNQWQLDDSAWLPINNTAVIKIGGLWTNIAGVWTNYGGRFYTNYGSGFNIRGVNYTVVITNRLENTNWVYYQNNSLNGNVFVDAQYVVLLLPHGLDLSGGDVFTVNTNADIRIWTQGDVNLAGKGQLNNFGNYTHAFSIYDMAGHPPVNVKLNGNASEIGLYYLPSSYMSFAGGGKDNQDFIGAVFCYSISISGKMCFHFDESLQEAVPTDRYSPIAWKEIIGH